MFYAQYFMLFLKIHMSVYLGGYNRTVTKKVLNISYEACLNKMPWHRNTMASETRIELYASLIFLPP